MSLTVSCYTLGCKLNQAETESAAAAFVNAGFAAVPWERRHTSDLLLINSCTVTSKAEQKARRILRLVLRDPEIPVVVTGCYARLEAEKLAALDNSGAFRRLFIIPDFAAVFDMPAFLAENMDAPSAGSQKKLLAGYIAQWLSGQTEHNGAVFRFEPGIFRSRALLKIQDGCDRQCAYCRVPLARGKSQSLASDEILRRLRLLETRGTAEAVFTGVNIVQYRCPESGRNLGELLGFLLDHTVSIALRLSSIEPEPGDFSRAFLDAIAHRRVRPHFHLPVQSGSAAVLCSMRRPYSPEAVRESAALLRKVKDDPFLACDMISGFPGETEADFEETCRLAEDLDFAWIHGFPYSPRPGTPAFSLKNRVSERESVRRLERLLELAWKGRRAYTKRWIGRIVDAVMLREEADKPRAVLSDNYLKLRVPAEPEVSAGNALRCRIVRLDISGVFDAEGEII